MVKQVFQFGDQETVDIKFEDQETVKQVFQCEDQEMADIKLHIIGKDGDEGNPVYLHSQILKKKSEFYEARLSYHWSLQDECPLELKITSSVDPEIYVKCFQLMYSCEADERFNFSGGVDEALDILPVVSEILFHEGIHKCMTYLDVVSWIPNQETELQTMLSSLQIKFLSELAARLSMSNKDLGMLRQSLQDMLYVITMCPGNLDLVEMDQYIIGYFEAANTYSTKVVADTCSSALLKLSNSQTCIESLNNDVHGAWYWSNLLWSFHLIRRCDWKLYEPCVELFCEDDYLSHSLTVVGVEEKLDILLNLILNPMAKGEIITAHSFRVSFLKRWLCQMASLTDCMGSVEKDEALDRGIMDLDNTLPLHHQKNHFIFFFFFFFFPIPFSTFIK